MTQYLVAIHHPDDYDSAVAEDDAMSRDIDALNDEMKAAGVRIFVGGLRRQAARGRCGRSPMVRCASPTGAGSR
jgi:3',5'-cyclic AMP phosphodiesterase CpdA